MEAAREVHMIPVRDDDPPRCPHHPDIALMPTNARGIVVSVDDLDPENFGAICLHGCFFAVSYVLP